MPPQPAFLDSARSAGYHITMNSSDSSKLSLFPLTAGTNADGHLCVGGCDTVALAEEFGTPLYVLDEYTVRHKAREFVSAFQHHYPDSAVVYASKALLNPALARILAEEGLGLDVVSGGELSIARFAGFPMERVYFHGNNKTPEELDLALELGVGRIVVDNLYELAQLDELAARKGRNQDILLRITPGVDPHTHQHTTTGTVDSKFGFPLETGQAEEAVRRSAAAANLSTVGLHFHLGSPIFDVAPYQRAIEIVLRFARDMERSHGLQLGELDIGGGYAVQYTRGPRVLATEDYAEAIADTLTSLVRDLGIGSPTLVTEPGRAIVGQAGLALYRTGAIKETPGVRKYVCVDGGMNDNIRPALYGAAYEALLANRALEPENDFVSIAGKLCESGDILVRDTHMATAAPGDLVAIPVCGAYCISMWSNYNAACRPAIVMTGDGAARLIRRRETYRDLTGLDVS